jgi:hypothetical protein
MDSKATVLPGKLTLFSPAGIPEDEQPAKPSPAAMLKRAAAGHARTMPRADVCRRSAPLHIA